MKTIKEIFDVYGVDENRLKRDYINNPIKTVSRGVHGGVMKELPDKDDAYYLYIEKNMFREDLSIIFDRSESNLIKVLREMGIRKDPKKIRENQRKTLKETKGVINVFQLDEVKEKTKQTNLEKYGRERYSQTSDYLRKVQETKLNRYGNSNYNNFDKYKKTCQERYGVSNAAKRFYNTFQIGLIENEDKLYQYIVDNKIVNIKDLSEKTEIRYSFLRKVIEKNDWYYLFDYSKSKAELEIRKYINQYYHTENNTKKYLDGKEIDIYIPELKLGFEFNGNFYHNEYGKPQKYHQQKSLLAESKGIFIYHIFEYDWENNKQRILNQIDNLLLVNREKIFARKCLLKEVSKKEKSLFLKLNHLQGNDSSSVAYGLYYNNELVSLMTFCKPRFTDNYEWELSRFCSKAGCNVVGGASCLFKHFLKIYRPFSIVSYSDIAHTKGNLYSMLGMRLETISSPNYIWFNHGDIKTRYQCQKHRLLAEGWKGSSETEIMHSRGYFRIFDCGNKVWVYENN